MRSKILAKVLTAALIAGSFAKNPLFADEVAVKGREILAKNSRGVVTVEVVQKATMGGKSSQSREAKQSLTGTVLDGSGLTVVALSGCDPSELYRRLSEEYKAEVEITDTKIMLEDGSEIPAEIVLRDKDLDLAFIRPKTKPATPMQSIDFKQSTTVDIMDEILTLNRLRQAVGRAYSVSLERVAAVVKRPRTFYVPDSAPTETAVGSPAFALDGKVVGLFVMRAVNSSGVGNVRDCLSVIIVPAEDVLKASAQAPEAKPDAAPEKDAKDAAATAPASAPKETPAAK